MGVHTRVPLWVVFLGGLLLLPLVATVGCVALVLGGVDRLSRSAHWPLVIILLVVAVLLGLVVIGADNYGR